MSVSKFVSHFQYLVAIALLIVTTLVIDPCLAVDHPNISPTHFCYDDPNCGPKTWTGLCATGHAQSPIDIQASNSALAPNSSWVLTLEYNPLILSSNYVRQIVHPFYGQNNGHTAQFELSRNLSGLTSNMTLCIGHTLECYTFAQLHFHWGEKDGDGSEHTVGGDRFPMELHLVHHKSIYHSLADALDPSRKVDPSALAVIAVLFTIGAPNQHLGPIIDSLDTLRNMGDVTQFNFTLKIADLIPRTLAAYASYHGSLTTPTCDEKVLWTVFLNPVSISEDQMDRFRALHNEEGVSDFNFRPTQPLNGRRVNLYRNLQS